MELIQDKEFKEQATIASDIYKKLFTVHYHMPCDSFMFMAGGPIKEYNFQDNKIVANSKGYPSPDFFGYSYKFRSY